jgi:hypothetical protein
MSLEFKYTIGIQEDKCRSAAPSAPQIWPAFTYKYLSEGMTCKTPVPSGTIVAARQLHGSILQGSIWHLSSHLLW